MKDWKAEYDKLRGELAEVRKQLQYERDERERKERRNEELRDKFKELLLDVLGR